MDERLVIGANTVALFCRLHMHAKKEIPLRSSEMGLLIYVVKTEAPLTPLMAATFFHVSKPMITAMVKPLCAKGYLIKAPLKADGRSFSLTPTAKAVTLVESVYDEYFKGMKRLLEGMGETKFQQLIALLGEANELLSKEKDEKSYGKNNGNRCLGQCGRLCSEISD